MIFLFFCICLIFSVAFHPPLMQSRAQPHLPATPPLSLCLLCCLPFPVPLFVLFTSVRFQFLFTLLQARHVFCVSFSFCCFPSIFPFFVCCAAVTFGHHHYHLPPSQSFLPSPPSCLLTIIIFGCCGCNPSVRSVPAIFIVLCTHNFILAHFWVVYFYGYI